MSGDTPDPATEDSQLLLLSTKQSRLYSLSTFRDGTPNLFSICHVWHVTIVQFSMGVNKALPTITYVYIKNYSMCQIFSHLHRNHFVSHFCSWYRER